MSQAGSISANGGGGSATEFDTDSGTATPLAGVINIFGGSNINTAGAGNTVTINLDNTVSILGSFTAGTTSGDVTVFNGNLNLPAAGTWVVGTTGFINLNSTR